MIKVVHYIGGLNFGGIERVLFDLVSLQIKNEKILPSIIVGNKQGEYVERYESIGINIFNAKLKSGLDINLFKFSKIFKNFKTHCIIHLHGFNFIIATLAIFSGNKVIFTEHGNFAFGRTKTISDKVNHFLRKFYFNWFIDSIVCNSNFTLNYLKSVWKIKLKHLKVIHNGSNILLKQNDALVKSIKDKFKDKFIVGTTSRLAGFKRIDRLIDTFCLFSQGKDDTVLIIVGEGSERSNLETLAKPYSDKIFFTGFVPNPIDYQSSFDVCIFPSQNEPFGLVAVESYSVGKPVLVFRDGGGLKEIVSLCNPDDIVENIEAMSKRIEYYYSNRNIKKNVKKVLTYFSAERMEREYFDEYKNIICAE